MNIDFDKVRILLESAESDNLLDAALKKTQVAGAPMGKEEAVLRLMIELAQKGQ
jgi:hypothetical protein